MACKPMSMCAISYFFNSKLFNAAVIVNLLAPSACASVNAQYNPARPHHTTDGFKNNYTDSVNKLPSFNLTDEPLDQPPNNLALALRERGLPPDAFTVMAIGETRDLPARSAP